MNVLDNTQYDVRKIWTHYDVNYNSIKRDITILKNWIKQQKHLPPNQDDNFLEHMLLRNKFRIEQTKIKLDNYFTLRGHYREFYQGCNEDFIPSKEVVIGLPMPKLTPNLERIVCIKLANPDPDEYDLTRIIKFIILIMEILIRRDYSIGERIITDFKSVTFHHIKKVSMAELEKIFLLYKEAYCGRPISIDVINATGFVNIIIGFFKLILNPKLSTKIQIHDDVESLYKVYPKQCLPRDYGGNLEPLDSLKLKWDNIFKDNQKFFNENYRNISVEELRVGNVEENEIFGIDGTFKELNLD